MLSRSQTHGLTTLPFRGHRTLLQLRPREILAKEVGSAVAGLGLRLRNIIHHTETILHFIGEYSKGTALELETCNFSGPAGCGGVAGSSTPLEEQNDRIDKEVLRPAMC